MLKKWSFFFQNHGLTPLERCQFFDFLNLFFYSLKRCFFVLEYRKRRFPGLYCLNKKLEKWKFLDQNHWLTFLEKCPFSAFGTSFFIAQKGVVLFQNIVKDIFLACIALKKGGKMVIFGTKPWVNPLGKMSIFQVFELFFYSLERRFFVLEYRKGHFPMLYCRKKKKMEKWPFLVQNHGLTRLEKCQFFDFLNFLFLQPRKAFFRSRIS